MTSNRAAVLTAPAELRIEDRAVPEPGPLQVLVEVRAVGVCGSDVHYYQHGRIGPHVVHEPLVLGHEAAGTVVAVGTHVDAERIGQTVALEPGVPCGRCGQCLGGRYNLCPDVRFFATPPVDGAFVQYVAIDAGFAHPAPAGLGVELAAMAEPVSVGVWASRRAGVSPSDRVLVTGAGPIGLLTAQVCRVFGARRVVVTDVADFRLEVARSLGLAAASAQAPLDEAFDVLVECSGTQAALDAAMPRMARTGRVVLVGMGADLVSFDPSLLQSRELEVTGTFRYANTYPLALDLIASGAVEVAGIITHRFGLDESRAALTLSAREPRSLKAVVLPQS